MPIRAIDPAKRGLRPVIRSNAVPRTGSDPAPEHHPQQKLQASSSHSDTIRLHKPARVSPPTKADETARLPAQDKRAHHVVDRTSANWKDGDYLVGRGRPPKATQWQKGQSGNPRGPKPREKRDPVAEFEREIMAEFTAKVNGEEVHLNMGTFVVQLLKAGAAKGTVKSQQMLLELFMTTLRKSVAADDTPEVEEWEQQVIDKMLEDYGLPAKPVFRNTDRTPPEGEPS